MKLQNSRLTVLPQLYLPSWLPMFCVETSNNYNNNTIALNSLWQKTCRRSLNGCYSSSDVASIPAILYERISDSFSNSPGADGGPVCNHMSPNFDSWSLWGTHRRLKSLGIHSRCGAERFNLTWRTRWPPHPYTQYHSICICLRVINLVSLPIGFDGQGIYWNHFEGEKNCW